MAALKDLLRQDHKALVEWVVKEYGLGQGTGYQNPHRIRRERIAERLELYRDEAERQLRCLLDALYKTTLGDELKAYVQFGLAMNVTARIVNEVASLYDRPALRVLKNRDEEFHAEEKRLDLHFVHQEAHRLTNLCNEVLLWQFVGVDGKTALRIITPNCFDAIPDPRDKLQAAGYLLDAAPIGALSEAQAKALPNYELWDDTYRYLINAYGQLVDEQGVPTGAPIEHKLGRIPGVLFHRRHPTTCILDASNGEDIKSAHRSVAYLDLLVMRLSKVQGEKQPTLSGNMAQMATGQSANGERPLILPPDVQANVLDLTTNPDHYLKAKRDRISSVAQRYGMSYEQFTNTEGTDVTASGKSYAVRREKLTELRLEQRTRAVKHEAEVVKLMGFDPDGMRVDYQEQAIPQDAMEKIQLLDAKMRKGLDSPIAYLMREDSDLDRADAWKLLDENFADWAAIVLKQRALNMPADGTPGLPPEQNGANNAPKPPQPTTNPTQTPGGDSTAARGLIDYRSIAREVLGGN